METRTLLQFLLVLWATHANGQLVFPGSVANDPPMSPVVTNRHNVVAPSVRTTERPSCSLKAGNDPNFPCVADDDYDNSVREHIQRLLKQTGLNTVIDTSFLTDLINDVQPRTGTLNTRLGSNTASETPVCQSEETLIFPKRARSVSDEWVFVLNQDNVEQAVRVEKCSSEGSPCTLGATDPIQKTVCKQKYIYRRLLTVNNDSIQPEEVLMPSCCVCYKI